MSKTALLDKTPEELGEIMKELGQPGFRAGQVFKWLSLGKSFSEMTNLPKSLREGLAADYVDQPVKIVKVFESTDGTKKFLFEMTDGVIVEGVLMSYKYGKTVCISTQAGCRMNCAFCASGIDGLSRNLTAGEILGQVVAVNALEGGTAESRQVTNIVLMGSGEPFDNFENVSKFFKLVNNPGGLGISERNISVSTCGLPEKMRQLADLGFSVTLTVSLHAADNNSRSRIMPVNKAHPIEEVIAAAKYYFKKTGRRVVFEYALIDGVNDSEDDAKKLAALMKGFSNHINIIKLNYVEEKGLKGTKKDGVKAFVEALEKHGASVTLRRTMGADIAGACGQLRNKFVGDNKPKK